MFTNDKLIVEKYQKRANKRYTICEFKIMESPFGNFLNEQYKNLISTDAYLQMLSGIQIVKKDVNDGDILRILSLDSIIENRLLVLTDCYLLVEIDLKRELKFFNNKFKDKKEFSDYLDIVDYLKENPQSLNNSSLTVEIINNRICGSLWNSYIFDVRDQFDNILKFNKKDSKYRFEKSEKISLDDADEKQYFDCNVISRNEGGFFVEISGVQAFLPGSLAAANKILDFDSLIGKTIPVMIEDHLRDSDTYIVSHKKYIEYILPRELQNLKPFILDRKFTGKITGCMKFGLFIEFNNIFTGLLHFSSMDTDFYARFKRGEFQAGQEIEFYIKEITDENKIILTNSIEQKLSTHEKFQKNYEGGECMGEIYDITNFGAFVKFNVDDDSIRGLLLFKNISDNSIELQRYRTYIFKVDKVIPEEKKVFLSI